MDNFVYRWDARHQGRAINVKNLRKRATENLDLCLQTLLQSSHVTVLCVFTSNFILGQFHFEGITLKFRLHSSSPVNDTYYYWMNPWLLWLRRLFSTKVFMKMMLIRCFLAPVNHSIWDPWLESFQLLSVGIPPELGLPWSHTFVTPSVNIS